MPKPNTRFLRNIIKDTNTHNQALLRKEELDSRARLSNLQHVEDEKHRKTRPDTRDIRKRQLGSIQNILASGKDGRHPRVERRDRGYETRHAVGSEARPADVSTSDPDLFRGRRKAENNRGRLQWNDGTSATRSLSPRRDEVISGTKRQRRAARNEHRRDSRRPSPNRRRSSVSPKPRRERLRSPGERKQRYRGRFDADSQQQVPKPRGESPDSDPLDDLIGPAAPPQHRGRGRLDGSTGLDRRFSQSYDPATDTQMETSDVEGDWDDAVEAFRDRKKLRQTQEVRLKAAGFTAEQIAGQNSNATVTTGKPEELVTWSKAGDVREWDRGKDGQLFGGGASFSG